MKRDFYDEYYEIEDRHWWFVGRRRILLGLLADRMNGATGSRILDVGCGTGTMLGHLARYGRGEGIDIEPAAVDFCRRRGLTDVQVYDGARIPYDDATFDLVTCMDVLEHVDDDGAMAAELLRVLRPGGLLVTTVPAFQLLWGAQDVVSQHYRRYRRGQLRRVLAGAGANVERVSYFNFILFAPIAVIRLLRRPFLDSADAESDFTMTRPGRLNDLLARLFALEAPVVRRRTLPWGVSLVAIARRP